MQQSVKNTHYTSSTCINRLLSWFYTGRQGYLKSSFDLWFSMCFCELWFLSAYKSSTHNICNICFDTLRLCWHICRFRHIDSACNFIKHIVVDLNDQGNEFCKIFLLVEIYIDGFIDWSKLKRAIARKFVYSLSCI